MSKNGREMTPVERKESHNRHEMYADEIARMYAAGESYRSMSRATGIPKSTVEHMCKRLSSEYARERYGDKTAALGRELQLLDMLTKKNLPRALMGEVNAAKIVMDAHIRRSRLLGLDATVRAEITVRTAQDIEIERLVQMMGPAPAEPAEPLEDLL